MEILDMPQGSEEWHNARLGIITMSEAACLLVDPPKTSSARLGKGAFTYMHRLVAERYTGFPADSWTGNVHTQRGKTLEPVALELYCQTTEPAFTETAGIILNHGVGYSPDLMVEEDGLAEVKTKLPNLHVEVLESGQVPKEHFAQLQGGLWVSEREWIDFVCYCEGMPLFVKRVYRHEPTIEKLARRCRIFYEIMEQKLEDSAKWGM